MPKATWNDEVEWPAVVTRRLGVAVLAGQGCCQPSPRALHPIRGAQHSLHRRLAELADFSLVWSFVVYFLAGGDHPPSIECPRLMAKVTTTGWPNPGWGQPFCCWLMAPLDSQPHSILLAVWGSCAEVQTAHSMMWKTSWRVVPGPSSPEWSLLLLLAQTLEESRGSCFALWWI